MGEIWLAMNNSKNDLLDADFSFLNKKFYSVYTNNKEGKTIFNGSDKDNLEFNYPKNDGYFEDAKTDKKRILIDPKNKNVYIFADRYTFEDIESLYREIKRIKELKNEKI
jgi:hypothetical protein